MLPIHSHLFLLLLSISALHAADITGKIFKVDPAHRSFELLKETEYDPKSDLTRSRFAGTWTADAALRKIQEKSSFAGIKGPVWTKFQGIDAANRKALAERKPFVARVATVFEGERGGQAGVSDNEVIGWFTPAEGEAPRGGVIDMEGKPVLVTLREKNSQLTHHSPLAPADLAQGFWQVTMDARMENDLLIASRIEATPLTDPRLSDDPKLPRVLVIGDSISMNYHEAAKSALQGIANYHRNDGNAFSSEHGVRNTELWLGNYKEKGFHWDVIQFNHGLHDLKQPYDSKTGVWGPYAIPLDAYKANLERQIAILRKTGAKLIFCTTTPVPNDNKSTYARRKGASAEFNTAALEVMRRHSDILVTDLHSLIDASPAFDKWRTQNDVHFYQPEEQQLLGGAVAATIRKALQKR